MEFIPGAPVLGDMKNGVLGLGTVPWDRILRLNASAKDAGGGGASGGSALTMVTLDLGTVYAEDMILVTAHVDLQGDMTLPVSFHATILKDSGTATIVFFEDDTQAQSKHNTSGVASWENTMSTTIQVTGTGTLVLALKGYANLDWLYAGNHQQMHAMVMYGTK